MSALTLTQENFNTGNEELEAIGTYVFLQVLKRKWSREYDFSFLAEILI